jgi:multiple sugar transport system substrate-binding protein
VTKERNPMSANVSRRTMLKVMGGFASAAALAACAAPMPAAAPAESSEGGEAPMAAAGTMVVAHRREYFEEMETMFAQAVADWGAANNVDVETTTVAAEASQDFVPKLLAQVQAGNPPDLVYHIRLMQALWAQNALEPVTDTADEMIALYGKPAQGQIDTGIIEGEWWGVPYMMHGGGQFGRRSKFEEAGFDPNALPTYDDIRDACLAISKPEEDFYGWGCTVNSGGDATGFIEGVIQNWGGHYTNEDITEVTFDSPETLSAVEWMTEIYTGETYAPMLPPGIMAWDDSSNNEAFLSGTIGYTENAASIYAKAKADGNPIFGDTVAMPTPVGPTNTKLEAGGGGQFIVPLGAANIGPAKELAKYMITPEVFMPMSLVSAGLFLPAYTGYYEMDEVKASFAADPNLETMGMAQLGDHLGASWPAQPSPVFDAIAQQAVLTDMMAQIIAQGMTPADAVAQAAERILNIGQEAGFFL